MRKKGKKGGKTLLSDWERREPGSLKQKPVVTLDRTDWKKRKRKKEETHTRACFEGGGQP